MFSSYDFFGKLIEKKEANGIKEKVSVFMQPESADKIYMFCFEKFTGIMPVKDLYKVMVK